ncbi:S8 family serine peptidase [Bdellovibrio sp. HCB209]|uniref:S8 family serine peptidase n=1 Tax=Bdellovibrio sp. HCB209 TaxID=3394354 RepID=UPI0039B60107
MTKMRHKSRVMMLSLAVLLALPSCKTGPSQDPRDSFWNGKFPRQLEWMRSQVRELSQKERDAIVIRQEKDARRTDLLRVGVIDSGVDIAHKDLQAQIDYRIVDGRVAGAGIDIMGNGPSGTHVMVDPTLFAFGAKAIKNGLIVEPVESPLQLIKESNTLFVEHFYAALQNDPEIKESVFIKLPKEAISLRGALEVTKGASWPEIFDRIKGNKILDAEMMEKQRIYDFYTGPKYYTPNMISVGQSLEHGQRFFELMKESMEYVDQKTNLNKNIELLQQFMKLQEKPALTPITRAKAIDRLDASFNMAIWGYDAFDPLTQLEKAINSTADFKGKSTVEAAELLITKGKERYAKLLQDPSLSKEDKQSIRNAMKRIEQLRPLATDLKNFQQDPVAYAKMKSDLRRYVIRTQHPYLDSSSNSNSHATHVSGVIARQNPDVRIVPIRVTTGPVALAPERQKEIIERYSSEFSEWLKLPIVSELIAMINKEYTGVKITPVRAEKILKDYLGTLKGTLDAVFIEDVLKAIEAAGKQQLKLANVSLGMTFKKEYSLDRKQQSAVTDLFSEFVRYKIGQTMQFKAPGTLFVVATGNDGGWIDGVTKTGFPVGITSTRFIEIAKNKGLPDTPNNALKNILAVGSINENGTLTAFSNILIDPKVPQVFSTGEEVYSSVPAKSKEHSTNLVKNEFKEVIKANDLAVKSLDPLPISERLTTQSKILMEGRIVDSFQDAMATKMTLESPLGRQNMSGTSMATPTVTGILANYLIDKMAKEHISSKDAYLHPSLMPEQVVKETLAMAKLSPNSSVITIRMLNEGIKKWGIAKEQTAQKQKIQQILRATVIRCEAVFTR